jgi:hypothetical protein
MISGSGGATGTAGNVSLTGGNGGTTTGAAGGVNLSGGTPVNGNGGSIALTGSNGVGTNRNGGNVSLQPGVNTGTGILGSLRLLDSAAALKIQINTTGIGFFTNAPVARPTVVGSRGGNAALASLLTGLASLGLIIDSSTP